MSEKQWPGAKFLPWGNWPENVRAAIAYFALIAVAYLPVVFLGRTLVPALYYPYGTTEKGPWGYQSRKPVNTFDVDLGTPAYYESPINSLIGQLYRQGEFPLWNSYQGAGTPLPEDFSSRVFFPYQILENICPTWTWDYFLLGRLWFAGLLTFLFLRKLGISVLPAFLGGIFYMFSGSLVWFINLEQMANGAMVLPFLLLALEQLAVQGRGLGIALSSVAICLVLLAGQPETAFYLLTFGSLYYGFRCLDLHGSALKGPGLKFVAACFLGLGLAAPLLLPFFLNYSTYLFHLHQPERIIGVEGSPPWSWLIAIIVPTFFDKPGHYVDVPDNGHWDYLGGYVGVLPFLVIFLGLTRGRNQWRKHLIFFGSVGGCLLLKNFGVPPFLWIGYLPIFSQAWSQRWAGPVWTFSLAAAAAIASEILWNDQRRGQDKTELGNDNQRNGGMLCVRISDQTLLRTIRIVSGVGVGILWPLAPAVFLHRSDENLSVLGIWTVRYALLVALYIEICLLTWVGCLRPEAIVGMVRHSTQGIRIVSGVAVALLWPLAPAVFFFHRSDSSKVLGHWTVRYTLIVALYSGVCLAAWVGCLRPELIATAWVRVLRPKVIKIVKTPTFWLCVGLTVAAAFLLKYFALEDYTHLDHLQRPFFSSAVLMGYGVAILTFVIALAIIKNLGGSRRGLYALVALALNELWFVIPKGYPPEWLFFKLMPWVLGLVVIWGFVIHKWRWVAISAAGLALAYGAIDLTAPQGLPDRYDPFTPAPYVKFLQKQTGSFRATGGSGVLMPNFASAVGVHDVRYIRALSVETYHHFTNQYLQKQPLFWGHSLWFTGLPKRKTGGSRWSPAELLSGENEVREDIRAKLKSYSLLGVKYFILPRSTNLNAVSSIELKEDLSGVATSRTKTSLLPPEVLNFPLIYDREVKIYENPSPLPRTFVAHEYQRASNYQEAQALANGPTFDFRKRAIVEESIPSSSKSFAQVQGDSTAEIVSYGNQRAEIRAQLSHPGLLILTDVYYPGWQAEVDGQPVKIYRVNGLIRGVWLPEGVHQVVFSYWPLSFLVGLIIAAMSGIVCVFLGIVSLSGES